MKWLSTKEYAELFGLNHKTVQRLCREGRITNGEVVKAGPKLWRIWVEDERNAHTLLQQSAGASQIGDFQ